MASIGSSEWADAKIKDHGWACKSVFPDAENDLPPFTYTVGFPETLDAPDVIIVGFPGESVHGVLAGLFSGLKSGRLHLSGAAQDLDGVIETFKVRIRPVPDVLAHETALGSVRRHLPPRVVQMLLPDPQGHLPGDAGGDMRFEHFQDISLFGSRTPDA